MCVLCDAESLRLLIVPAGHLRPLKLAESIRVAREAAGQYVVDVVDGLRDEPGSTLPRTVDPEEYVRYVVGRAQEDGVGTPAELRAWTTVLPTEYNTDPRVQGFLSSAVEGISNYHARIDDQRVVLARFLESRPDSLEFDGVGMSGELYFREGEDSYAVLSDDEALQIAVDRVAWGLHREDPSILLQYTSLPDGALDILVGAQKRPEDEANQVLAGMVDVAALAEDTLRQNGYAWLVADPQYGDVNEQRFGDRVIVRFRTPEESLEDEE